MIDAGIDLDSFNTSVAHGLHSITMEHLTYFFGITVPKENNIPTVNTDLKGQYFTNSAPKINSDPTLKSIIMHFKVGGTRRGTLSKCFQ